MSEHGTETLELREEIARLTAMIEALMAAQNQPSSSNSTQAQNTTPTSAPQTNIPTIFPYGLPPNFTPEGYYPPPPVTSVAISILTIPNLVVHTITFNEEPVYLAPSEGLNLDEVQDQLHELRKELWANREKNLFGKNARDLCLVPNVKLPAKFKVPDFEKYKGDTFPETYLTLYSRRISAYTDNHQVLIYYFQDSLAGAALKWYMGLNNAEIRTFEDLGESFVRQYHFNMDMAPDRDLLRSLS